jgi:hypothetical protein
MLKKWPKEDRKSWEDSVVMKEFESQILSNYQKIERFAQQAKMNIPNATKVKEVTKALNELNTEAGKLSKTLGSAADDGAVEKKCSCNNASDKMCDVCADKYSSTEVALAKKELINDLQKMADEEIKKNNIKRAYKIERIISEIEEN